MKLMAAILTVLVLFVGAAATAPEEARLASAGGQITSIDATAKSLIVKVDGQPGAEPGELTLVLADDSKIVKNGKAVTLSDLERGDKVTVTYRPQDGKNVVINIGVEPNA